MINPMFYVLFALAVLSRFLPHPPNFAAIGALGLFVGCYLPQRRALLIPVAAMLLSDLVAHLFAIPGMGFYHPMAMVAVYVGFAASGFVGRQLRSRVSAHGVVVASIVSSLVFFVISNFGVYLAGHSKGTPMGLLNTYWVALPFLGATLAGDLIYSSLMFGIYEWTQRIRPEWVDGTPRDDRMVPVKVRKL